MLKTFAANLDTVPQMMDFVAGFITELPEQAAYDITLACEEILVNIASYAYPETEGEVSVSVNNDAQNRKITLIFEDAGVPFNPLLKAEPDLSVPFMERDIGGLGIMMVRERADDITYAYENGRNVLTFEKRYDA